MTLADALAFAERQLSADEFEALLRVPIADRERDDAVALIRWFRSRYPSPAERLAYVRRAYARWKQRG